MAKVIDVPGFGPTEFPDTMSDNDIVAAIQKNMVKPEAPGFLTKVRNAAEGILEPTLTVASGAVAYPAASLAGFAGDIYSGITGGPRIGEDVGADVMKALTYQPRSESGQENLGIVAKAFEGSKLAGLPVAGQELATVARLAGPSARQATTAAVNRVASVGPQATPEIARLGAKLESIGGKVPLHSLAESHATKAVGSFFENLPMSGSTLKTNKIAFNRDLIRLIGGDTENELLTPSVLGNAMERSGKTIGGLYSKVTVPADEALMTKLNDISASLAGETDDVARVVSGHINDILAKTEAHGGVLPGEVVRKLDSKLGARMRANSTNGDLIAKLDDVQEALRDGLTSQLPKEDIPILNQARKEYATGKTILPLVAKYGEEGVSPAALGTRVRATPFGKQALGMGVQNDLTDLVRIGETFMKDTPMRVREAMFAAPIMYAKAVPGLLMGQVYNRLGPKLASSKIAQTLAKEPIAPAAVSPVPIPSVPPKSTALVPYVQEGDVLSGYQPNFGPPSPIRPTPPRTTNLLPSTNEQGMLGQQPVPMGVSNQLAGQRRLVDAELVKHRQAMAQAEADYAAWAEESAKRFQQERIAALNERANNPEVMSAKERKWDKITKREASRRMELMQRIRAMKDREAELMQLQQILSEGRPVTEGFQGPKTRAAQRGMLSGEQ